MPSSSRKASPAKSASPKATRSQTKRGAKESEPEVEDDSARGDRGVVPPSSLVPRGDPASVAALAELKSLLDRFPPETLQALVTRPASVTRPLQEEERRSTSLRLLDCVDSDVYHLLDEAARLRLDDARADIVYAARGSGPASSNPCVPPLMPSPIYPIIHIRSSWISVRKRFPVMQPLRFVRMLSFRLPMMCSGICMTSRFARSHAWL